jgi:hypothetical protein
MVMLLTILICACEELESCQMPRYLLVYMPRYLFGIYSCLSHVDASYVFVIYY